MVFHRLNGIGLILLGLLLVLFTFGQVTGKMLGINYIPIAVLWFLAHEIIGLIFNRGPKWIAAGVPLLFILIVISYFLGKPTIIAENALLIIGIVMISEGAHKFF